MAAMTARKKALITGGEYGMGRGIGLVLAEEGYDIAFSYYPEVQNDEKAVKTTRELLAKKGAESFGFASDLSKPDSAKKLFEEAVGKLGTLDLLVNNAGVNIPKKCGLDFTQGAW